MAAPDTLNIASIELDTSIQCRAAIDTGVVSEYAEALIDGAKFPPIEVYGTQEQSWLADGWHRVLAAKQIGMLTIEALLHEGTRADALRHALGANANHGHRRTNADKRRAVEIALREFGGLTNTVIAEMCGVSDKTVEAHRPATGFGNSETETRTGRDGKQYPATRTHQAEPPYPKEEAHEESQEEARPQPKLGPPCVGMQFARIAVMKLSEISANDTERERAFEYVRCWIDEHA